MAGGVDAIAQVWHASRATAIGATSPVELHQHREVRDSARELSPRLPTTTAATIGSAVVGCVVVVDDEVEQLYVAQGAHGSGVAAGLVEHDGGIIAKTHGFGEHHCRAPRGPPAQCAPRVRSWLRPS